MKNIDVKFRYSLKQEVFWLHEKQPAAGRIIRRGYQETLLAQDPDKHTQQCLSVTNNFYEVSGSKGKAIFSESDFGFKVFDNPTEFVRHICK